MEKLKFFAYAISTGDYQVGNVTFDHTFVVSDRGDNWHCWGRGKESVPSARHLAPDGVAFADWGDLINGTDPNHPTGLTQRVSGVCQQAANRLLVLAGTDVSGANGNFFATMVYGKYGFEIEKFIAQVKSTAAQLNQQQPGAVTDAELQEVLGRIAADPSDELKVLESHFKGTLPQSITQQQTDQLLVAYRAFQQKRQTAYDQEANKDDPNFQRQFAQDVAPAFLECVSKFTEILGVDCSQELFKSKPEDVIGQLFNL